MFALLFAACSSGDDAPGDDDSSQTAGIALAELCGELAAADCDRIETCGLLAGSVDRAACRRRQEAVLCAPVVAAIDDAVRGDGLAYFELAARECRAAIGQRSCEWRFDYDLLDVPACAAMLEPRAEVGEDCHLANACVEGAWCNPGNACPGTCTAFKRNNDACDPGDRCADGFFCGVVNRRCLAQVALDAQCEPPLSGNSCTPGGFCDSSTPGMSVCRPVRGRGAGCQTDNECLVGARCIANRCSTGEDGDNCADASDCGAGLICPARRCVAPVAPGGDCSTIPCSVGNVCRAEVCEPQAASGEACLADGDCFLGRCENDKCVDLFDDGAACSTPRECFTGRTCDERCVVAPRDCAL